MFNTTKIALAARKIDTGGDISEALAVAGFDSADVRQEAEDCIRSCNLSRFELFVYLGALAAEAGMAE